VGAGGDRLVALPEDRLGKVVPSPTSSLVLDATWLISFAPMFSKGCGSSTSLLTVTPSLVMRGEPKDFWIMTLRPVGPIVTLTASASFESPCSTCWRASCENIICLAIANSL
jgi:hypothetical protein